MKLDNSKIVLDLKVQNRYRELISRLGAGQVKIECFILGDSDVNYELGSEVISKNRILSSPYHSEGIKYPLIYNGLGKGIRGVISCFVRYVDSLGNVLSYYNYPNNTTLTIGSIPPSLENGLNNERITFSGNQRQGAIIFFQTLMDYYYDENGVQQRIKEKYKTQVLFNNLEIVPNGWEIQIDYENGSMMISKDETVTITGDYVGSIGLIGTISKTKKVIYFNV